MTDKPDKIKTVEDFADSEFGSEADLTPDEVVEPRDTGLASLTPEELAELEKNAGDEFLEDGQAPEEFLEDDEPMEDDAEEEPK